MERKTTGTGDWGLGTGRISQPAIRNPQSAIRNAKSAFTLTELLVVIAIIAILGSLAVAAAVRALHRGKEVAITFELKQLSQTAEEFKNKYSAYPPNGMSDGTNLLAVNDIVRFFRKAFPRHKEDERLIRTLAGMDESKSKTPYDGPSYLKGGLTASEAVYFWFGGFSEDPQYPISGDGGPSFDATGEVLENRNRMYEFDMGRLGPRTEEGLFDEVKTGGDKRTGRYIDYKDPRDSSVQRRINLWAYYPKNSEQPLLYFDASRHDPMDYDLNLAGIDQTQDQTQQRESEYLDANSDYVFAFKKLREGVSVASQPRDVVFVNKGKYQFIHSGLDDAWGSLENGTGFWSMNTAQLGVGVTVFPTGPFTGEIADTLTNFTDGTLESAQE